MDLKPKLASLLFAACITLLAGIINYYFLRPDMVFFNWLQIPQPTPIVINNEIVLYFLAGYFSDITWCISLCLIVVVLERKCGLAKIDKAILLSVPFISEFAQYFSISQGTFDWLDIVFYAVVILIINLFFSFSIIPINMQKVKTHFLAIAVSGLFLSLTLACASSKPVVNPKVSDQQTVPVKDAEEASIKTDQANVDFSVEVNKKYDLSQAWKLTTQIVTDYFDDIEVSDRETSYLRTAWSVRSFRQATIRTRLIIKLGNSDPLTFKIKLVSEYSRIPSASVKSDEQFIEWDRILRRYQNVIGDFSARLGNK